MATPYPIVGVSIALAGADKLIGEPGYEHFFGKLGWSEDEIRQVGAAEVLGGVLMVPRVTRRLGAAIVIAASVRTLLAELEKGDIAPALSRTGVLLAALGALVRP